MGLFHLMEFLDPEKILRKLNLKKYYLAADFGCGSGNWTIALAKLLTKGKVIAIDILEEPLSALRMRLREEGILNVDLARADVEKRTPILPESLDLVLITNLLFEAEDKIGVLKEAKRVLKKKGRILIVDWKEDAPFGPEKKIKKEEILEIGEKLGLKLEEEFEAGSFHFGLVFIK